MGSEIVKTWGAERRDDFLWFAPEKLTVVTDKKHALYDERVDLPLEENMVLSIMAKGVKVPILVRLNGSGAEVVDGKRRTLHAIEANRRLTAEGKEPVRIPAIRQRGEDGDLYGTMILTNEIRKGDTPLVKARKAQKLIELGKSEEEAALAFGCTTANIRNMLKLLDLHPEVQKAIEQENFPASIAKELSVVEKDKQPEKLAELVASGNVKGARGLEAAKKVARGQSASASKTKRMMSRVDLEEWSKKLAKLDGHQVEIANSVIRYILGHERSLANYPKLRGAVEGEEK